MDPDSDIVDVCVFRDCTVETEQENDEKGATVAQEGCPVIGPSVSFWKDMNFEIHLEILTQLIFGPNEIWV